VKKLISGMVSMAAVLAAPMAFGQTCASPGAPSPITTAPANFVSACTAGDEFNSICGGSVTATGTSAVYSIQVGAANTFVITVTPTVNTYDQAIFLIGPNSCLQTTPCVADADNAGPGGAETLDPADNLPAGTYYLVIDSTAGPTGCVPSNVGITATLPVSLQNFSVE
jgi:hypothetical protein